MNFLTINIKGVVDIGKSQWINNLRKSQKINFLCMQETLKVNGDKFTFDQFWGNGSNDMEWINSTGRSGGLVSIWDPGKFQKIEVIKDMNFILVRGKITGETDYLCVLNIYAPQALTEKKMTLGKNFKSQKLIERVLDNVRRL